MKKTITFSKFDAELNTDPCDPYNNAELTLTLRMGFRQINPAAGANAGTHHDYGDATEPTRRIVKWSPAAWSAWKANFVATAQAFWTGKFWLINDSASFPYKKGTATYFPNVWCRFKLEAQEATVANNHHTIDVVRLAASENWFGSNATLFDSRDTNSVRKATTSTGRKVMQRAHVHEVGHLLGLDHVDVGKAHCPASGDTNATACYGVADADLASVMGSGMELWAEHAYPWREALRTFALAELLLAISNPLAHFLGASPLAAPITSLTSVWPAKLKRHYPRTEAELKAGTMITARPSRPI
ncbi:MAG TPA: hypothetical protein VJ890_02630 [Vineibacter sp.]|nr:hypothetical protein [Vineibacter sp.]